MKKITDSPRVPRLEGPAFKSSETFGSTSTSRLDEVEDDDAS
jgi:hypothetical protein